MKALPATPLPWTREGFAHTNFVVSPLALKRNLKNSTRGKSEIQSVMDRMNLKGK